MQKLVANKAFTYARRALKPGDSFDAASRRDARVLVATGRASRQPEDAAPAVPVISPAPVAPIRAKRRYNRRDLTAEK